MPSRPKSPALCRSRTKKSKCLKTKSGKRSACNFDSSKSPRCFPKKRGSRKKSNKASKRKASKRKSVARRGSKRWKKCSSSKKSKSCSKKGCSWNKSKSPRCIPKGSSRKKPSSSKKKNAPTSKGGSIFAMKPFHYKDEHQEFMIPVTKESLVDLALIMRENTNAKGKKEWVLQMLNQYHRLNKHAKDVKDNTEFFLLFSEWEKKNPQKDDGDLSFVGKSRVLTTKQKDEYLATIPNIW